MLQLGLDIFPQLPFPTDTLGYSSHKADRQVSLDWLSVLNSLDNAKSTNPKCNVWLRTSWTSSFPSDSRHIDPLFILCVYQHL